MNAKKEFLDEVKGKEVLCASIHYRESYDEKDDKHFSLERNYSETGYENFLTLLDFEYDDEYGGQKLFGIIWYKDGTWSERGEYDGSEWWEYKKVPEIPSYL